MEYRDDVIRAHSCSIHNKNALEKVDKCGCFYCLAIFNPNIIKDWCDNENTAICPYCGVDSIIYDNNFYPVEKDFLEKMKKFWF